MTRIDMMVLHKSYLKTLSNAYVRSLRTGGERLPVLRELSIPGVFVVRSAGEGHHVDVSLRTLEGVDQQSGVTLVRQYVKLVSSTIHSVVEQFFEAIRFSVICLLKKRKKIVTFIYFFNFVGGRLLFFSF